MDIIGKFNSDSEYLEAVKTLVNCTQKQIIPSNNENLEISKT